jgi:hypothetical protein
VLRAYGEVVDQVWDLLKATGMARSGTGAFRLCEASRAECFIARTISHNARGFGWLSITVTNEASMPRCIPIAIKAFHPHGHHCFRCSKDVEVAGARAFARCF